MELRAYERAFLENISCQTEWRRRKKNPNYTPLRRNYSESEHEMVVNNLHLKDSEIATLIGRTRMSVKKYRYYKGIFKGRYVGYNYKDNLKQYQNGKII